VTDQTVEDVSQATEEQTTTAAPQSTPIEGNGLKVTAVPLEGREMRLTIEVSQARVESALQQAARQLASQVRIPGFRKGKAPFHIMLRYVGREALLEEALEPLTKDVYEEALHLAGVEPFAQGRVEDIRTDPPPLTLEMIVPLEPVVEIGDYRAVRMDAPRPEVSDEMLNDALQTLREQRAVVEDVERPAQLGDLVTVTVRGRVENQTIIRGDEVEVILDPESDRPGPGFAQELVGARLGQERTFTLHYPEDHANAQAAGRDVDFHATVHKVQSRFVPPLNDDFARSLEDEHVQTALDLRIRMRQQLQESLQRDSDAELGRQVIDKLIEGARIEYPPVLVEREIDDLAASADRDLRLESRLTLDDYLKMQGKTRTAYREELRPRAETRLRRGLALAEVIKQEGLAVTEGEIRQEIDSVSAPLGDSADKFRELLSTPAQQRRIENDLLTNKAVARLVQIAKGQSPEAGDEPSETSSVLVP
jgi:trigger factor